MDEPLGYLPEVVLSEYIFPYIEDRDIYPTFDDQNLPLVDAFALVSKYCYSLRKPYLQYLALRKSITRLYDSKILHITKNIVWPAGEKWRNRPPELLTIQLPKITREAVSCFLRTNQRDQKRSNQIFIEAYTTLYSLIVEDRQCLREACYQLVILLLQELRDQLLLKYPLTGISNIDFCYISKKLICRSCYRYYFNFHRCKKQVQIYNSV